MTFIMHKKALMKKLEKRRKYEMYLDSHFSGKPEKFDNVTAFGPDHEGEGEEDE